MEPETVVTPPVVVVEKELISDPELAVIDTLPTPLWRTFIPSLSFAVILALGLSEIETPPASLFQTSIPRSSAAISAD